MQKSHRTVLRCSLYYPAFAACRMDGLGTVSGLLDALKLMIAEANASGELKYCGVWLCVTVLLSVSSASLVTRLEGWTQRQLDIAPQGGLQAPPGLPCVDVEQRQHLGKVPPRRERSARRETTQDSTRCCPLSASGT